MSSVKLNAQDKKDLDKFTKFLALKAAQIIVQSRLGEKVQTQCKPHSSGADWSFTFLKRSLKVSFTASVILFAAEEIPLL
ncbi:autophagy protein 13 [Polyplax serrata]|uniref:Autophagy protein 13 n=1 Tax=Polyplax serrata TaxID=468196 RepID=A0AAN8S2S3_POLSC